MKLRRDENGMMVVEALFSFTIFVMVIAAIVYLIAIFTVHNKIQFAINSVAHELASYSYLYQAFGIRSADSTISSDGATYVKNIDDTTNQVIDTLNKIEALNTGGTSLESLSVSDVQNKWSQINSAYESGKESSSMIYNLVSNPNDLLVGIIYMAADAAATETKSLFAQYASIALTGKYLKNNDMTADEYLRSMGVIDGYDGLDFSNSSVFCDSGKRLVDIVVEYDIDLSFVKLLIPKGKLHMVQRVTVAGWIDGDGATLSTYGVKTKW
jgi:hypothetical protein